jgi:anaerobic magnesium-protoporphyrin IX monomethyl ester cyclase
MHVALVGAEFEENLAVRYLQGALEHAGHRVSSIVFNEAAHTERAARDILRSGAQLVGFSMVFTYRAREFAALAARARELGFRGHIVAGGHFAAFHAAELLRDVPAFDSIALGEGELLLVALAQRLHRTSAKSGAQAGRPADGARDEFGGVAGLVWRSEGCITKNPAASNPQDLDVLPVPPRKSPFDNYLGIPITNILSSRGCRHSCAFCSIAAWHKQCGGERLRLRSPEAVADEMAALYRRGVRIFNFHDDNFVLDDRDAMRGRLSALGRALVARGAARGIAFAIKCRPGAVDESLFAVLKTMGLFRVFLGIEAGTEDSLRKLGRGQTVGENERALRILNGLDLHVCFNLLMLHPDSTLEDFRANVAFLRAHPNNAINFCRTEIYAGTPLERRMRRQNRLLGDYWGYDYRILDPHAQAAFEVFFPAFESRNYGESALHHLAMQIDYEQQILRHFFGPHDALRRQVKRLIVTVNHNTCDHLEAVARTVPHLSTPAALTAYAAELRRSVAADDERLGGQVRDLLDRIRRAASDPPHAPVRVRLRKAAATASVAATVGLVAAGCHKPETHAYETVALPPMSASGAPPDPNAIDGSTYALPGIDSSHADASKAESVLTSEPPFGPEGLVRAIVKQAVLTTLIENLPKGQDVELEIWVADDGNVSRAILTRPTVEAAAETQILDKVRRLQLAAENAKGQRYRVVFGASELQGGAVTRPTKPRDSHSHEYVARPRPRPEMVPRPSGR